MGVPSGLLPKFSRLAVSSLTDARNDCLGPAGGKLRSAFGWATTVGSVALRGAAAGRIEMVALRQMSSGLALGLGFTVAIFK